MATVVEFILRAKDEATQALGKVTGGVTDLESGLHALFGAGAGFGLIAAGATAAAGAAIAAAHGLADTVEQLDRTAFRTGVSIQNLQVMQEVIREGGGDVDAMTSALTRLNKEIGTGNPLVKRLGLDTTDTFVAFKQLAGILASIPSASERTAIAYKLLGKGSGEVLADMVAITEQSDTMRDTMRATGQLIEGTVAENARKADKAFDSLGQTWRAFMTQVSAAVTPFATVVVGAFTNILAAANDWAKGIHEEFTSVLDDLAAARRGLESLRDVATDSHVGTLVRDAAGNAVGFKPLEIAPVEVSAKRGSLGLDDKTPKGKSEREKTIERIVALMNVGRGVATELANALDRVEADKKRAAMLKSLDETDEFGLSLNARVAVEAARGAGNPNVKPRTGGKLSAGPFAPSDAKEFQKAVDELLKKTPRLSDAIVDVAVRWATSMHDMTSAAALLDQGLGALYSGLESGFSTVFQNLTSRTQTFRSAIKTIFSSLVQEVLAILGRIVAAKIFSFILRLIPGIGTVAGAGAEVASGGIASARPATGGNVVINIQALNARDAALSLLSPRGELRAAANAALATGLY